MEEWETCKENVLPVKVGRSVAKLNESLQSMHSLKAEKDKQQMISNYESKIQYLVSQHLHEELLDLYVQYFKYIRDSFPSSSEKILGVLEVGCIFRSFHCESKSMTFRDAHWLSRILNRSRMTLDL